MKRLLVVADIRDHTVGSGTWELAAAARRIREGCDVIVAVPAVDPGPLCRTVAEKTGLDIVGIRVPGTYSGDVLVRCLGRLADELSPSLVLTAHTARGRDLSPALAVRLGAAAVSGVSEIRADTDGLTFYRPVMNGTKRMGIRGNDGFPVVASLVPGAVSPESAPVKTPGRIEIRDMALPDDSRITHIGTEQRRCDNRALTEAPVVVAAGRGIGESGNLDTIRRFADCFPGAAVGASRPLVDMGWIDYSHQVGITGARVAPGLYIACGISGSSQHLAGMQDARYVVSINKNPDASMHCHADLRIVADVMEFIRHFIENTKGDASGFSHIRPN